VTKGTVHVDPYTSSKQSLRTAACIHSVFSAMTANCSLASLQTTGGEAARPPVTYRLSIFGLIVLKAEKAFSLKPVFVNVHTRPVGLQAIT